MTILPDDCFLHDRDRLKHDEALALIHERLRCVVGAERIALDGAAGRVLAEPVIAPRPVPGHDNAAVDGYAYRWSDTEPDEGRPVAARIAAGDKAEPLRADHAARIFTGAPMPEGADTVAMQEDCILDGDRVRLPMLKQGANRRRAGEDVAKGERVAVSDQRLRPQDLAAIASTGTTDIAVRELLRVALISTGNELLQPGEPFRHGGVYDSNRVMLRTILEGWHARVTDGGHLADSAEATERTLKEAAHGHHVVVTSGGASRGDEDHILGALDRLGTRHLWQLAVKPGRPMLMGQIGDCIVIGLPGNPVAAMVCALLYVRPILALLEGATPYTPRRYPLHAAFSIKSKPDRREFLRGHIEGIGRNARIHKFARDGSGLITGLRKADGLIEVPETTTRVAEGDIIEFLPFTEFGVSAG